jgi:hypothetical protein
MENKVNETQSNDDVEKVIEDTVEELKVEDPEVEGHNDDHVDEINEEVKKEVKKEVKEEDSEMRDEIAQVDILSEMRMLIKNEYIKTIKDMINEVELAFDYVKVETLNKIKKYVKGLEKDDKNLIMSMKETNEVLSKHTDKINKVLSGDKIKTIDLKFMSDIVLFEKTLKFSLFSNENKNTKRVLIKYLDSLNSVSKFTELDSASFDLNNFINSLKGKVVESNSVSSKNVIKRRHNKQNGNNNLLGNLPDMQGMDEIFGSLMGNPEIMNMAKDVSENIKNQNIDPMQLLTSLLSGKPNKKVESLVNNISSTIERKIESGQIDKDVLERQAANIMSSVSKTDLFKNIIDKK